MALKQSDGGSGWADLLPLRPRTRDRPDSAGPVLRRGNRRGLPYGRRMRVGDDGVVRIGGGFMTQAGDWLRSGVTFRFAPDGGGVRLTFRAQARERFEYSAFFREAAAELAVEGQGISGGELSVRCSEPVDVELENGYSSGADPRLVRARLSFRAAAEGPVWISAGPRSA